MKHAHAWIVLGLFLASAYSVAAAPAPQDPEDVFRSSFQKALDGGQKPEQLKLVKNDSRHAALWIARTAEALATDPASKEKPLYDALAESWKSVWKGEFPERELKYLSGLDAAKKKTRDELLGRWKPVWREFEAAVEKKDGLAFANILDEVEALAGAFDSEGDLYHAAEAYRTYALCCDEGLRGASADLHHAWVGYGHALEMRDKLDYKDGLYEDMTKRKAALAARGAGEKGGAAPAPVDPKAGSGAAPLAAASSALVFEVLSSPDAITRPLYNCDELYQIWNGVGLKEKGTASTFPTCAECPLIVRTGPSDVRFDTDGDKAGDEKIPMTGNITPVRVQIGKGDKKRPWAFFGVVGSQQDSFEGIQVNLSPDDRQYQMYTLGAASVTGTIGTTPVRIVDDSLDGEYGNVPLKYGSQGLTSEQFEPWLDSIVIGASKRARPWSPIQEIDGAFYRLEVQANGTKLAYAGAGVDTGILKLEFKGPVPPNYVVVTGSNDTKDCYYDLVEGGTKGVRVPVGTYTLAYGEVRRGKKRQMQKVLMLPSLQSPASWTVRKGETTSVTLGAPFSFDFRYEIEGGKIKVRGKTVVVTGSGGERYERAWNCVPKPEVFWRKKGAKQSQGDDKMPSADYSTIEKPDLGWAALWFPLDLELETKEKGNAFEVQLMQKKHDLFGKVESAWRE